MAFLHANDEYHSERIQYDKCDVPSLLLNKLLWCICPSQPYNSIGNCRCFPCKFAAAVNTEGGTEHKVVTGWPINPTELMDFFHCRRRKPKRRKILLGVSVDFVWFWFFEGFFPFLTFSYCYHYVLFFRKNRVYHSCALSSQRSINFPQCHQPRLH